MPYKPTEEDKAWARNVLSKIKDHGIISYKDSGLSFLINKAEKELVLINNDSLMYHGLTQQFIRTYYVFRAIGWDVKLPPTN